jgi:cyclopropane fatty-acyl-phospholipid synthase-like methyltransferase
MSQMQSTVTNTLHSCPVCGAQDIQLFMTGIFDSDSTKVMECRNCGLQFLFPIMTKEEETQYYDGYYRKQQIRHFNMMDLDDLQRRARCHYEQYRDLYSGLVSGCQNVLEIGSGTGGFLSYLTGHHPEIRLTALERCNENVDFIRQCFGKKVSILENLNDLGNERFDFIAGFGVLEHIRESRNFLVEIRDLLTADGRIALNVPNKFNQLVYAYGSEAFRKFTYMKQHYYTFTEDSLQLLAEQSGLRVEKFNYMQVWGLDNHISWLRYGRPRDYSNITRMLSPQTLDNYAEDMIRNRTTDLMMVVFSHS